MFTILIDPAHNVEMSKLDLNLVYVAESLYRHGNVSRAAKELGLSQSAVSHALANLRAHFQDPLFVRVPKGVVPTETAKALRASFEDLAERGRRLTSTVDTTLDLSKARGRFTIASTDYLELLLIPRLLPRLRAEAPGIQLSLRPTGGELPKAELTSGIVDVACAGFYSALPDGFFQARLFRDDFAVGMRRGHPLSKGTLTEARFLAADHALITLQGDFKPGPPSPRRKRTERNIVYGSYSFTGMAWSFFESDLLLVAPRRLLEAYRQRFPIVIHEHPTSRPRLEMRMIWHALTHRDPLKRRLRELVQDSLRGLDE